MQNIEDELTHDKLKHMEDIFLNADVDNIEGLSIDEFRYLTLYMCSYTSVLVVRLRKSCDVTISGMLCGEYSERSISGSLITSATCSS